MRFPIALTLCVSDDAPSTRLNFLLTAFYIIMDVDEIGVRRDRAQTMRASELIHIRSWVKRSSRKKAVAT